MGVKRWLRQWWQRFGWAEIANQAVALGVFTWVILAGGAYLTATALAVWISGLAFYGVLAVTAWLKAREATSHLSGLRRYGAAGWHVTWDQGISAVVAEVLYSVAAPLIAWMGVMRLSGPGGIWLWVGFLAAKLPTDALWFLIEAPVRAGVAAAVGLAGRWRRPALEPYCDPVRGGLRARPQFDTRRGEWR